MSITVASVSITDFKVIIMMESYSIGIFEAVWMNQKRLEQDANSIFGAVASTCGDLPVLYHVIVNGSDDAEDFVVDKMLLSDLPAVAIFSRGGKVQFRAALDSSGAFDHQLFTSELRRVKNMTLYIPDTNLDTEMSLSLPVDSSIISPFELKSIVSSIFGSVRNGDDLTNSETSKYDSSSNSRQGSSCTHSAVSSSNYSLEMHTDKDSFRGVGTDPMVLFLSGDKSSVGKSSTCLAILASLKRVGVSPSAIAYIKVRDLL